MDEIMSAMGADAPPVTDGKGDLGKIADLVRELSDKLEMLKGMLPAGDAAEEHSETIDQATAEGEQAAADPASTKNDDDKESRKAQAVALIGKQLG